MRLRWWRKRAPRLLMVCALFAALSGVSAVQAPPAAAACHDVGCNGLNPNVHCQGIYTVPAEEFIRLNSTSEMYLQVRYSGPCAAFWGRVTADTCSDHRPPQYIRIQRQLYSYYGWYTANTYYSAQVSCAGAQQVTPMVANYGNDRVRASTGWSWDGRSPASMPEGWWDYHTDWVEFYG